MKVTAYQKETLQALADGQGMFRGKFDRYWWEGQDKLCSAVARRLKSKGLIRTVYLNSVRDKVELTPAGKALIEKVEK